MTNISLPNHPFLAQQPFCFTNNFTNNTTTIMATHKHAHSHATAAISSSHGQDFTEANRAHWDDLASKYTAEPWQKDMIAKITAFLTTHAEWIGLPARSPSSSSSSSSEAQSPPKTPVRILDYACGPGTVTAILAPQYGDEWRGLDLSENMAAAYNARFSDSEAFSASAVQGNLLSSDPDKAAAFQGPEWWGFDMVDVGLGFHHFEDLEGATRTLVERVKPGGVFMIVDLVSHEMEEGLNKIVAHAGFSFEQVKRLFKGEGLVDVQWKVMDEEVLMRGHNPRRVFVARGKKPA
jgi:SAM-dependent methyltransferase